MAAFAQLLFGFRGRVGRVPFVLCLVAVLAAAVGIVQASLWSLPAIAALTASRGVNAAFVLNVIWSVTALLALWAALALTTKRLRARRRGWWLAVAAAGPLSAWALLNDAIFLVSRWLPTPAFMSTILLAAGLAFAVWVLVEAVVLPERD